MSSINAAMGSVSMGTSKSVTGSLYNATSTQNIAANPATGGISTEGSSAPQNAFMDVFNSINQDQHSAQNAINDVVSGKTNDVQAVVMQTVKAEMSFQMFMEVRNQMMESYNELLRMQF